MLALPRRVRKEIRIVLDPIKPISAHDPIIFRNESLLINFKNIIDYIFWLAELTEKM